MKKIIIAIDGPAGSGKSTTAKEVAKQLNYIYIDTGAMYRAMALGFKKFNLDFTDSAYEFLVKNVTIELIRTETGQRTILNGSDVSEEIRTPEITKLVSPVSANPIVRAEMIDQQRKLGYEKAVVMDGRDIGTVVFPAAELKIFMIATAEQRAKRRTIELINMGIKADEDEILKQLLQRDNYDSTREHSPLVKANDAVEIDTSNLTIEEQTNIIVDLALDIIQSNNKTK